MAVQSKRCHQGAVRVWMQTLGLGCYARKFEEVQQKSLDSLGMGPDNGIIFTSFAICLVKH